jgi:hypothetical protein
MGIILSNSTYNRFDNAAEEVKRLQNVDKGGKGAQPFKGAKVQRLAKLTAETTTPNGKLTWKASEVYLDETGLAVVKVGGFEWTDDNPVFTLNPASINDVIMVSQAGRPAINPDPAKRYWFGNPGGGGGGGTSMYRLRPTQDFTLAKGASTAACELIDDQDNIISGAVVYQNKFTTADFYANEILYGIDYSLGGYLLDPFLAGIGG